MTARRTYRPWTTVEETTLRALWCAERLTAREISEAMDRGVASIQNKLEALGLRESDRAAKDANPAVAEWLAKREAAIREVTERPVEKLKARLGLSHAAPREPEPLVHPPVPASDAVLEPILIISDAHVPYHSPTWWDLLLQVGRAIGPKHLVIIGDFADFYSVSAHDKSPDRAHRFAEELEVCDRLLDELDRLGATDKLYIEGNHEDRLKRYLMKSPELSGVVSTEKLLKLHERGWTFVPYKHHASRGAVHFTHDVGAAGRNAVFRALDTYQHSVVTGHTHRLQYVVEGSAVGDCKISAMFGWGGDVEAVDYMNLARARKDWALGFGVGYLDPATDFVYLVPVPVVHGTCMVNGQVFRAAA